MTLSVAKITQRQWQMETWVWSTDGKILTSEKVKKRVNLRTGLEVQLYSFFNLDARWGGWSTSRSGQFTPWKETRHPLYRRLGGPQQVWTKAENISTTRIRWLDRPARSSHYTDRANSALDTDMGNPKYSEKNLSQCYFASTDVTRTGIEWWGTVTDRLTHGTVPSHLVSNFPDIYETKCVIVFTKAHNWSPKSGGWSPR